MAALHRLFKFAGWAVLAIGTVLVLAVFAASRWLASEHAATRLAQELHTRFGIGLKLAGPLRWAWGNLVAIEAPAGSLVPPGETAALLQWQSLKLVFSVARLKDRNFIPSRVELRQPQLAVIQYPDGRFNYSSLLTPSDGPPQWPELDLQVEQGRARWEKQGKAPATYRLDRLSLDLKVRPDRLIANGGATLLGTSGQPSARLAVDQLQAMPLTPDRYRLQWEVLGYQSPDPAGLQLTSGRTADALLTLKPVRLDIPASSVELAFKPWTAKVQLRQLAAEMPAKGPPTARIVEANAAVEGPAGQAALTLSTVAATPEEAAAHWQLQQRQEALPAPIEAKGQVRWRQQAAGLEHRVQLQIADLQGQLPSRMPFRASGEVDWSPSRTAGNAATLAGTLGRDRFDGRFSFGGQPPKLQLDGTVKLDRFDLAAWRPPAKAGQPAPKSEGPSKARPGTAANPLDGITGTLQLQVGEFIDDPLRLRNARLTAHLRNGQLEWAGQR